MLQNIQNHFQGSVVENNAESILNAWLIAIAEYYAHYKLLSAHLRGEKTVNTLKNRQSAYINQCQVKEVTVFLQHMENQLESLLADIDCLDSLSKDSRHEGFKSLRIHTQTLNKLNQQARLRIELMKQQSVG